MRVDTHCHLDFNSFDQDRAQTIQRAREAGLIRILNPGIDLATSQAAIQLANSHREVYAAVGVHPNQSSTWDAETRTRLKEMAAEPKVIAIGEIGLDYYRNMAPRDLQKQVFREQLSLAGEIGLPVVIHNREATEDVLEILAEWRERLSKEHSNLVDRPGVLHSFSGGTDAARQATRMNFYLGITGPVTFKSATELQKVVIESDLENLLIETDAPFLTPYPKRGERNEPANVILIVEKIAELRRRTFDEIASVTTANARRLFLW